MHTDLSGIQGSTYSLLFTATDNNGAAISLSGYSIRSTIRNNYADPTGLASFTSVITVPDSGICSISMAASGMAAIPAKIYLYSVESYLPDESDAIKLIYGHFYLEPQISY